jgi:membrane-bound acyltransferase YfiQ involved in biofilm formation
MQKVEEIFWLRAYGCIAVFLFHLMDQVNKYVDNLVTDFMRIPLVLGTPIFLFISVFVFAVRYDKAVPEGFIRQRVKYVMLPYFVYGFIYSTAEWAKRGAEGDPVNFWANAVEYFVYAGWHGYFLIIAMQFYVGYWLFTRLRLWRVNPVPWFWLSCLISMAYWGTAYWQGVNPPGYLLWVAPLGWLYLFFLALVLVRYYPLAPNGIKAQRPQWMKYLAHPACLGLFVFGLGVATLAHLPAFTSKEVWVIPFFVLFTLCATRQLKGYTAPNWVRQINVYSFGIYLAHPMFFIATDLIIAPLSLPIVVYAVMLALVSMTGCIVLSKVVNTSRIGAMMFGKKLNVAMH